ncbi:MAG: MBL fold metallo-hydrolase [Candidatus Sumerlaeaceae bacterium]|nr:MBL fold metallo-hydrolase [Candidatus Sumerlaeaceae bacterium]
MTAPLIQRFVLSDLLTNGYLVYDPDSSDAVMIDPGGSVEPVSAFLRRHGLTLRAILNTHGHADHIMGNVRLRETTGAPIGIHALDVPYLSDPVLNAAAFFQWPFVPHKPDFLLADGGMAGGGTLKFEVLHTPGHTPGSCCLVSREHGIVFGGDLVFEGGVGRWDVPGGDPDALMASLRKFARLPGECTVYPGHGNATTVAREVASNPYILQALAAGG